MQERLNLRVNEGDIDRLREIARQNAAVAPSGLIQGEPSISMLLKLLASGELAVCRPAA